MKQFYFFIYAFTFIGLNAQLSTGAVNFEDASSTAKIDISSSEVTFTLTGPNDRLFSLVYGEFSGGNGMDSGNDIMWFDGTSIIDGSTQGFTAPLTDATNNLTLVSNTNDMPSSGLRTLVVTRPLTSSEANNIDWDFSTSDSDVDMAMMQQSSAAFSLSSHGGGANADQSLNNSYTNLSISDFTRLEDQVQIVKNMDKLVIESGQNVVQNVIIYSSLGQQLLLSKSTSDINIRGLENGVYFIEIQFEDGQTVYKKFIK